MIKDTIPQYSYEDLAIVPAVLSRIKSRKECKILDVNGHLPLFTAPMSSVVDIVNYTKFEENGIYAIIPRTESIKVRLIKSNEVWCAFSLSEFEEHFVENYITEEDVVKKVVIDIANGHMAHLYDLVRRAKGNNKGKLKVMVGNIANPLTYHECVKAKVDYVRLSIGSGFSCTTSSNVSIHYGCASLIDEVYKIKESYMMNGLNPPQIIADGGVRNYSDIIKALALGADYVMCGYIFAKMVESAEIPFLYFKEGDENKEISDILNDSEKVKEYIAEKRIFKKFYGMSTKIAQKMMGKEELVTSEGISRNITVDYTMKGWIDNFSDYLRSAMSYCDANCLEMFKGHTILVPLSTNSFKLINK